MFFSRERRKNGKLAIFTRRVDPCGLFRDDRGLMDTRMIPSSGEPLPVIGCGSWKGFDVGTSKKERAPIASTLQRLFAHGGSVVDSSPTYGRAEGVVGDLLTAGNSHEKAFIATKVWVQGRDSGIAQMLCSMESMRRESIDLMQVHNLLDWRTHLATLRAWKKEGRIRYVGVTHYMAGEYRELESVLRAETVDFVQLNYSLDRREAEERLLPLAADRGIAVIVNQPFNESSLLRTLRWKKLPPWAAELGCNVWAQVLLKFILSHPAVTCVIPGTASPKHMDENCLAGVRPFLDAEQRDKLIRFMDEECA